ncbi:hypothetical protein KP509_01G053800 [Ceratopteris richardii]|nr:hypothetical protein KP509_01G053800 [Ceratopteris richardii]
MLAGHAQQANDLSALQLIEDMQAASIRPNRAVFLYSMKACSSMSAIMEGMHLHDQVLRSSLDSETGIVNVIVDIYSKCGCLREAHQVHNSLSKPSVVSWGTLVYGYIQSGRCCIALELLKTYQREAFLLDKVLYLCSMKAARSIGEIKCIKMLHVQVIHDELVSGEETVTNALLDAYVKCGDMDNAHQIFEHRGRGNLISCSSMIGGYAELGHGVKALKLYNDMRAKGVKVDKAFCLSVIKACSALGALDQAKEIHDHLIQSGIDVDTEIGNSLVHMYAKCGVLLEAGIVLDRLPIKDEFSWCAMIAGYASSGDSSHMKQCLADMHLHGVKPNDAIYCSLLSACSHVGAVIEGIQFLDAMREHRVQPNIEHFTSIIDLLCRAGLIDEAKKLFFAAYGLPGSIEWTSVLSACRSYGIMCISSSHKDHGSNASCSLYNDFCTYSEQETNYLGNFIHQIHTLKDSPKYTKESCYRGLSVLM